MYSGSLKFFRKSFSLKYIRKRKNYTFKKHEKQLFCVVAVFREIFFFLFRNKFLFKNYNITRLDILMHPNERHKGHSFFVFGTTKNCSVIRCKQGWHMAFCTVTSNFKFLHSLINFRRHLVKCEHCKIIWFKVSFF